MTTKFIALISVIGLASICLVQGQSPTPGESPAASPSPAEKRKRKTSAASPTPASPAPATPTPGGGPGMVWVSPDTHVYYKQGSRFYGKTKNGKYMSEADAIKEGNRPAAQVY